MSVADLEPVVTAYLARCVRAESGCLVNPAIAPDRYGEVRLAGRRMAAHRAVLAVALGRIPGGGEVTRHSCDNKPCVETEHLAFGTQSQNLHDEYARQRRVTGWAKGEERPQAVLTEAVVCEMRSLARSGAGLHQIADRFGVPYGPTRAAVRGETWQHIAEEPPVAGRRNKKGNPHAYRLSRADEARRVADLCATGLSLSEVAARLGIGRHTAWRLLQVAREMAA